MNNTQNRATLKADRKNWISLLGSASINDLETAKQKLGTHIDWNIIVKPEAGMLMVQAEADGSHPAFNLGEMSVTKCVLQVQGQYLGYAMVMGCNLRHAELAALFDGLLQHPDYQDDLKKNLITMLAEKQRQKESALEKEVAKTKVDFFTLKRGE